MIDWMKEFVLVVVCIKASEINETTADTVNPFLPHTTKPIIPVVTFWDMWRESLDFDGITSEEAARKMARKRIASYFPHLKQQVDETIFVSAKACMEAKRVDAKEITLFTPEWNIDNVRRKIASYVQERIDILRTQKSKESALDSQRRTSVRQLATQLCSNSARYVKNLQSQMKGALPKGSYEGAIDSLKEEFSKELEHEKSQIANQIERSFRGSISSIGSAGAWGSGEVARIKEQADLTFSEEKARSAKRLLSFFDRYRASAIDQAIRDSGLEDSERARLDSQLKTFADGFRRLATDSNTHASVINLPSIAGDVAKNWLQAVIQIFKGLMISNLPLAIGLLLVIPVLGFLWPLLSRIPYLNMLPPILAIVYGVGIVGVFYSHFKTANRRALHNAVQATINENSPDKIAKRIGELLESDAADFLNKVAQLLENKLAPIDSGTRRVLDDLAHDLKRFDDSIREVRQLI